MAKVGGRNAGIAWFVGLLALAAIGVIGWLALPLLAPSASWIGSAVGGGSDADGAATPTASGPAASCRALYPEALWSYLSSASGGDPLQDASPPVTTATEFATALAPEVRVTCTWVSDDGTVTSTVATVGPDAGAIALAALPALGFTCDSPETGGAGGGTRVRCSRSDDAGGEEIDLADGIWVSSSLTGWQPARYASRVAERVFEAAG